MITVFFTPKISHKRYIHSFIREFEKALVAQSLDIIKSILCSRFTNS